MKIGDVFSIRLNQDRYCYGQVVSGLESWSPVSLEKAVFARFVTGEWDPYYNDLIYTG
ncbi:Imm26 family immunity protein [Paenibacillus amylolyticus]|uniref:Imm26 family immunity protein n=1 Tax=Paenibacillus amylolyticus TaxID=1451 RepID=UPI003D6A51FA